MPTPSSNKLRTGRYSEQGRVYLLTTVVLHREPIFTDWHLGRCVITEMRNVQQTGALTSLALVVMPEHFHWLVELHNTELADVMRTVKSCSTKAINRKAERSGPLWQPGFHDRALRRDEDLKGAARYILANPLRAKLVTSLRNYPLWDAIWL